MKNDFITVKIFNFPGDIAIVQSYMEMMGIDVYMKNLVSIRLSYPFGGIEMQVKTEDYDKAVQALIEGGFSKPEDFKNNTHEIK